jgi:hypothetical protein
MIQDKSRHESKAKNTGTKDSVWDCLIQDAKEQIGLAQRRVADLRKSVRFFEKQRESGIPFPVLEK